MQQRVCSGAINIDAFFSEERERETRIFHFFDFQNLFKLENRLCSFKTQSSIEIELLFFLSNFSLLLNTESEYRCVCVSSKVWQQRVELIGLDAESNCYRPISLHWA